MRRSFRWWVIVVVPGLLAALMGVGYFFMSPPCCRPASPGLLVAAQGADVATAGVDDPGLRNALRDLSVQNSRVLLQVGGAGSEEVDLTPMYGDEPDTDAVRRQQTADRLVDDTLSRIAGIDRAGGAERSWLTTLDTGARTARAAGISEVILLANPLATAPPLAMQEDLWSLSADEVVGKLAERGYLPDTAGLNIQVHLLDPAIDGPQQPLEPPVRSWLEDVVAAVVTAGGGESDVLWLPGAASASSHPATVVPMPQPTNIRGRTCTIGTINFRANTATPVDGEALRHAVGKCAKALASAEKVTVSGYASADGTGDGVELSTRRAQFVARYLMDADAGIDPARVTIRGYGSTGSVPYPPASNPRNRVVIVRGTTHQ